MPKQSGTGSHCNLNPWAMEHALSYRTYCKAQRVLEQYQHMPSFHGIQKDCSAIVSQLKVLLRQRLESKDSSASTVAETVDLLLALNEPAKLLCQQFLEKYV